MYVSGPRFTQLALGCCYAVHIHIIRLYIERNIMHVELIRFRKQCRLHSCLLLRSDVFKAIRVFTLG